MNKHPRLMVNIRQQSEETHPISYTDEPMVDSHRKHNE